MKSFWKNFYSSLSESKWQAVISIACLASIALHFFLKIFEGKFFGAEIFNLPLFAIIAIGGLPLLFQILLRLLNKNLGADLLAFIALIVAVFLGEYLAATLDRFA